MLVRVAARAALLGVAAGLLADDDAARHPEVEPQVGPLAAVGLDPHRLAAAQRARERAAEQRVVDVARAVRAADVGVRVVDADDLPAEGRALDQRAGTLDFGELRHR